MALQHTSIPVAANGAELTAHGTSSFPCGCYYCDPMAHETPWHWHDEFEYLYVTEGEMLYLAGNERYLVREGDAVFVNGGVPHAVQPHAGLHSMEVDLVCHPRMLYGDQSTVLWARYFNELARPSSLRSCVMRHDGEPWEREAAVLIAKAWLAIAAEQELYEATARDALTRATLLALLHGKGSGEQAAPRPTERTYDRIKGMVEYVEDHCTEPITIERIAQAGQVSVREAQRAFHEVMGQSPIDYLNEHRLLVAARELLATDEPVGAIARRSGFGSQSYFNRRFRDRYGCTPGEYRALA